MKLQFSSPGLTHGDEGMWTLDNLPLKTLKERYGFAPTDKWVEHVRLASVRFNDGGSGAFVSKSGLVLTNHHVALGQLQKMSSAKKDYAKDGFFAKKLSDEMKCPDLELNQLVSLENVSRRVLSAVKPDVSDKEKNEQRKAAMARIEKESTDQTKLRSDVVELYQGGEYWLYRYKKFVDIRLVMAPEQQAAFYGGDPDNFTYPRYDLDFAFFRVYEDGKPAKIKHWFKWSKAGAEEGELVFVTGHPGSTDRLKTARQLEYERDRHLPDYLKLIGRRTKALYEYSKGGKEQERRAKSTIFSFENGLKAISGELEGLRDAKVMGRKVEQENALKSGTGIDSWDKIAAAVAAMEKRHEQLLFRGQVGCKIAGLASTIVRYVAEVEKPNEKRFEEYRDSALESLNLRLFSPAPIYPDMEEAALADAFAQSLEVLGPVDAYVQAALGGKTPEARAEELVDGTKLFDAKIRKALVEGGADAVAKSDDALIVWARAIDPAYRELRKWFEDNIQSVEALEGRRIAEARFALYGKSAYPDATFTLRLSFGRVAGYEQGTTLVPYKTTFYGLYDRAASFDGRHPFALPPKVAAAKKKIELSTPLDFVTTNDIIGGNSGSPVFNRKAEYVGLIFDGNIQSLVGRYAYDDAQNRAVCVHSAGIVEAMREIYGMDALARELLGK